MDNLEPLVESNYLSKNIKKSRESRARLVKECAAILGVSSARYLQYESGKTVPALPELEALSYYLQIPLSALLSETSAFGYPLEQNSVKQYLEIRKKIIAAQLKLKREELEYTDLEVAKKSGINISRFRKFESGETSLTLIELERLVEALGLSLKDVEDKSSSIGLWQETQDQLQTLVSLLPEVKNVLAQPDIKEKLDLIRKLEKLTKEELEEIRDALKRLSKLV